MSSRAEDLVRKLAPFGRLRAKREMRRALDSMSVVELAALTARWGFWAREKQLPPACSWRTWGFLTGRGFGKTLACSSHINEEVEAGRAKMVLLLAQDEASSVAIQVKGPSGLIATAPPWNRPEWSSGELMLSWPNGATAYVRTPEVPGKIRGLEYHLAWMSELQSWPHATRVEAFDNVFLSTRLGYSRVIWDATPKKKHPLLKTLLADHLKYPDLHFAVRGTTHENAANLGPGYVADLERKYGGTARGREELLGELLEDSEAALVRTAWIRQEETPSTFARKVLSLDPAVTDRKGSDNTGIILAGLGHNGRAYVLGDWSGVHAVGAWADIAITEYLKASCDYIIAETNKGGSLIAQNLRAAATKHGLQVHVLGKDEVVRPQKGVIGIREVYARGTKADRAEPVATAYERGSVVHIAGASLGSLEDTLTTWEPDTATDSPGDLDALVHAIVDLLELNEDRPDPAVQVTGFAQARKAMAASFRHVPIVTKSHARGRI